MSEMTEMTEARFRKLVTRLNRIVEKEGQGSALRGLETTTFAFAALLDIYAMPNPENPEGMCDDLDGFRKHFADLLVTAPRVRQEARTDG